MPLKVFFFFLYIYLSTIYFPPQRKLASSKFVWRAKLLHWQLSVQFKTTSHKALSKRPENLHDAIFRLRSHGSEYAYCRASNFRFKRLPNWLSSNCMYLLPLPVKPTNLNYMEGKEHRIPSNIHFAYIFEARNGKKKKNNFLLKREETFALRPGAFKFSYVSMKANLISINQNFVL